MENRRRIIGLDYARVIAAFMVCVLHSSVARDKTDWLITSAINDICQVCVPLFFMVSGAANLLRTKILTLSDLFRHKIPKLAVPFILWSLVYVFARIATGKIPLRLDSFTSLLYEPAYYQFWFMYTLLAIYLLLPLIQILMQHTSKKQIEYLLWAWFVFSIIVPMLQRYIPWYSISVHVDLILCEGYIGYFILGYYLITYPPKCSTTALWGGYLLGIICAVSEGFLSWKYRGYWNSSYLTVGTAISAVALFAILIRFGEESRQYHTKINKLSSLSENIYYVHMLVLTGIEAVGFDGRGNTLLLYVKAVIIFLVSAFLSQILQLGVRLIRRCPIKKMSQ